MSDLSPAARAITDASGLVQAGLASPQDAALITRISEDFRLRVTSQMTVAAADSDAVARQFVPTAEELVQRPEDLPDPIGDEAHSPVRGLTHRYPDRVILHVTKTCEVYCRFCFRRETVGEEGHLSEGDLSAALDYVAAHSAIWEVVLTGGDPLVLSPRRLGAILGRLSEISHVGIVRFHTRVPVVAPERITDDLLAALKTRLVPWMVVHTNHADELTQSARNALTRLADAGVPLLSQSVLLRGINDRAEVLEALFRALVTLRVKPYYLHHCDLARGAGHFRTTIETGQAIMATLRGRLSGTCLPTYVIDIPGGHGKVPIGPDYLARMGDGVWKVTDWRGKSHTYEDPR